MALHFCQFLNATSCFIGCDKNKQKGSLLKKPPQETVIFANHDKKVLQQFGFLEAPLLWQADGELKN